MIKTLDRFKGPTVPGLARSSRPGEVGRSADRACPQALEPKAPSTQIYSHPGVDRIISLRESEYIPCITHILSTSGW